MVRRPKIGLALGGGGARGLAHIGVLKILEREKITLSYIAGTSAGAIAGAMYAQQPSIDQLEQTLRDFICSKDFKKTGINHTTKKYTGENLFAQLTENIKERIVINVACSRKSFVNNKRLKYALDRLLINDKIENTKIPFGAVCSDLIAGCGVLKTKGDIIPSVMASSSIPGFLPPVDINDQKLTDGVVTDPVPVRAAKSMGADIVIAVDVSTGLPFQYKFDNIIDIFMRNNQMTGYAYKENLLAMADLVIRPKVGDYHWTEFDRIDQIIDRGIEATENVVSRLRDLSKRHFTMLRKLNLR